jgi:hypothetical protein
MSAHSVDDTLVRLTVFVTKEQKRALAEDAGRRGKAMAQILRSMLDERYFETVGTVAGWQIHAEVRRPEVPANVEPARARLREWVSGLGRRR